MENKKDIFNIEDYMFIPKGFKLTLKNDYICRETRRTISPPFIKTYTNHNGKIIKKIDNINFDDPFFKNFSQKEKDDFLNEHDEIIDMKFYFDYFIRYQIGKYNFLNIVKYYNHFQKYSTFRFQNPNFTNYTFEKNGKILDADKYVHILINPKYKQINKQILKYVDIPKGTKLTLKFTYNNDTNYDTYIDLLPFKKTYSNPDGKGIIMGYEDVDFDHPIFENLSDDDITIFFNNYMKMLDNYFLESNLHNTLTREDKYYFEIYLKKYFVNLIDVILEHNINFNGLPCKKLFKRKERPDICYSCSKRKIKNNDCIYIGFA